ncbi:hypothetical protein JHV675_53130 [Mycobacterium avium subsp. hominissuis]
MGDARRKRKRARGSPIGRRQPIGSTGTTVDLDRLLIARGWVVVDRADEYAIYDWSLSAPDIAHDITCLIIDLTGRYRMPPYRLSLADGERVLYHSASALVTDLDAIEARRCGTCRPTGRLGKDVSNV